MIQLIWSFLDAMPDHSVDYVLTRLVQIMSTPRDSNTDMVFSNSGNSEFLIR